VRRALSVSLLFVVILAVGAFGLTLGSGNTPKLGLDLQGGLSVVLAPTKAAPSGTLGQAKRIISRRVEGIGVAEPSITQQGSNIVVELPGVKDARRALDLVGQTAELRFRPVLNFFPGLGPSESTPTTSAPTTNTSAPPSTSTTVAAAGHLGAVEVAAAAPAAQQAPPPTTAPPTAPSSPPPSLGPAVTPRDQDTADATVVLADAHNTGRYQLGPTVLTGDIVSSASARPPQGIGGGWTVEVTFKNGGVDFDKKIAEPYYQQQVAIVLDHVVESAPRINSRQFNGRATIDGGAVGFSHREASNLALVLRYGALPIELAQRAVQTVSPTLGRDSLRAGIVAGIIGLALVLLYMIVYYRALGLVVVMGLCVSGALMYSLITYLGNSSVHQALSLAGAVGIIVSVGVTVDSYVVYFERLKDDIRSGKTVRSSVDRSFGRAWRTIWTADLVSIIGAALLFWLTVGPVRGFAFFLGLSTLLDLFVAFFFTRPMVVALGRNRVFTEARFLGVARGLLAAPAAPTGVGR